MPKIGRAPNEATTDKNPQNPFVRERWVVEGLDTAVEVDALALNFIPPFAVSAVGVLFRQPFTIERRGYYIYDVFVEYNRTPPGLFEYTIRGRTTGGTQKIVGSLETVAKSPDAPDYKGLIGVQEDGTVEGIDIGIPILEFSIEIVYPVGVLNQAMMRLLSLNTYKTNAIPWLGWAIGEVLYTGSEFEDGTNTALRATHNIAISPNLTNETIAGLTGISKKGWDALWFLTKEKIEAGPPAVTVKRAVHWYSERVYRQVNIAGLLGFG